MKCRMFFKSYGIKRTVILLFKQILFVETSGILHLISSFCYIKFLLVRKHVPLNIAIACSF
jgi:hypothetical protein